MKVGETYKAGIPELGEARKIHIVAVIDEGLRPWPLIVFRWYGHKKQYWHYFIKTQFELQDMIDRVNAISA